MSLSIITNLGDSAMRRHVINKKILKINGETIIEQTLVIKTTQKAVSWRSANNPLKACCPAQISFMELAKANIPNYPNPREVDITKKAYKSQRNYAENNSEFEFYSSSLVVAVHKVDIINDSTIHVTLRKGFKKQNMNDGFLDGGHRNRIIKEVCESGKITDKDYRVVNLIFIEGFSERKERADLGYCHNDGVSNTLSTKEDTKGAYDLIKDALEKEPYALNVAYKQNAKGVKVISILKSLVALNVVAFPNEKSNMLHPHEDSIVKHFAEHQEQFEQLSHLFSQMIYLSEYISYEAYTIYTNAFGINKDNECAQVMFGHPRLKNALTRSSKGTLLKSDFSYFVLASFRHLIVKNKSTGKYEWIMNFKDVMLFVAETLPKLLHKIKSRKKDYKNFGVYARVRKVVSKKIGEFKTIDVWKEIYNFNKKEFKDWKKRTESSTSVSINYLLKKDNLSSGIILDHAAQSKNGFPQNTRL